MKHLGEETEVTDTDYWFNIMFMVFLLEYWHSFSHLAVMEMKTAVQSQELVLKNIYISILDMADIIKKCKSKKKNCKHFDLI